MKGRLLALVACMAASEVARAAPPPVAAEQAYVTALQKERLLDASPGSAADLARVVREADALVVAGETERAATRLYLVVEGGRFSHLADTDDFRNAQFLLGVALARGGAIATARRYLERLAAEKGNAYAEPALRRLVDIALTQRDAARAVARIEAARIPLEGPMAQEVDFLRGRAAYDAGRFEVANDELRRVGPSCRLYSTALYLRGVIAVRKPDFKAAQDAFCVIAAPGQDDPLRFVIDGRYYTVRDLARLALGRIAHEEGRYDDAFYHYFTIPSDSRELANALFESAWSMLQKKDYSLSSRLVEDMLKSFPRSPVVADAELLRATLKVKTCRFAEAEQGFDAFLAAYEPVARAVAEAERDPAARLALARRLLAPAIEGARADTTESRLARLLSVDPAFYRLEEVARGLRDEAERAAALEAAWASLAARLSGTKVEPVARAGVGEGGTASLDAAALHQEARALQRAVAAVRDEAAMVRDAPGLPPEARKGAVEELGKLGALETRRARLAAALGRAATGAPAAPATEAGSLAERVQRDRAAVAALRARAARVAEGLESTQGELLRAALAELTVRLPAMLRHARLGKIDAVIGAKKRLEKQIQDLAAGRFPAEMASRLHIEGLIGDDEEYWPPEKERWADEYEGYR